MTPKQKLDALVDLFAPEIRAAFLAAIQDIADTTLLNQVVAAIERGDPEAAFRALGFSDAAMRPLTAVIEKAFEQGGVLTGATFPRYLNMASGRGVFRFDVRNSRAEAWLRDHSSSLVTRLADDARINVRSVLTTGMEAGLNPRNVALDIIGRVDPVSRQRVGGIIGLTQGQERWVRSYRAKLENLDPAYKNLELRRKGSDSVVDRAIASGKPLPIATVDRLVLAYKNNALKYRGDSIGRTEALQALNRSEYEATQQIVEQGAAPASAVKREWDSAGDKRVRFSHRALDGQRVGLSEPFVSPSGARMLHPGDTSLGAAGDEVIMCRCRVRTVIDWYAVSDVEPTAAPARPVRPRPAPPRAEPAPVPVRVSDADNDAAAKAHVLTHGKKTKKEALVVYDSNSGIALAPVPGTKNSVKFTQQIVDMIKDPNNAIVLHHNHPSSGSFSHADLDVITKYPGAKAIWAHGLNGSSYYADKGARNLSAQSYKLVASDVKAKLQRAVNQREMTPEDANAVWAHTVTLVLHQRKQVNYKYDLQGNSLEAAQRSQAFINRMLHDWRVNY